MKRVLIFIYLYLLSLPVFSYELYLNNGLPLRWNEKTVTFHADLDLNGNVGPFGIHWNEAFAEAASYWSASTIFKISVIENPGTADLITNFPCPNLDVLTTPATLPVAFSAGVCSFETNPTTRAFTGGALAVTQLLWDNTPVNNAYPLRYAGIYFNQAENWDIYNGANRPSPRVTDFRRIAAHEIGHILGLGHDDSDPPTRLMTTSVSDVEEPQLDDLAGVLEQYGPNNDTSTKVRPGIITSVSSGSDYISGVGNSVLPSLKAYVLPGGHVPGRVRYYLSSDPGLDPRAATPIAEIDLGLPAGRTKYTGQLVAHRENSQPLLCDRNIYYYASAVQDTVDNAWTYSHVRLLQTPLCAQSQLGLTGLRLDGLAQETVSFNPSQPDIRFSAIYTSSGGDLNTSAEMRWNVSGFHADVDNFGRLTLLDSSVGEYIQVDATHQFVRMFVNNNDISTVKKLFLVTKNSPLLPIVGSKTLGSADAKANVDNSSYEARGGIFEDTKIIDAARIQGTIRLRVGEVTGDNIRDMVVATSDRILIYNAEHYNGFLGERAPLLDMNLGGGIKINEMILQDINSDGTFEIIVGAEYELAKPKIIIYRVVPGNVLKYSLSVVREIVPGAFGGGVYASSVAYQMKPVRYLPNRSELMVIFDGTENDPRGIGLYNVNTGVRRIYYDVGPHVKSVAVSDDGQYYGLGLRTDIDGKAGKGFNSDLNSSLNKTISTTLSRLVLQDNGGSELVELNNQVPPSLETSGTSEIIITDIDNSGGEEVLLAVSHQLGTAGAAYIKSFSLAGNLLAEKIFENDSFFAIQVDNLNRGGQKEIIVLDIKNEKVTIYGPDLKPPSDLHSNGLRNAFVANEMKNISGTKMFISDIDNDPYKEILIMGAKQVKALDSQVMNTQFSFASPSGNTLNDVITADTNMDMAAEVILVTLDKFQVHKTIFDSNTPPIIANIETEAPKNTSIEIPLFGLDSDGDEIVFGVNTPNFGTVAMVGDGIARYTPKFGAGNVVDKFLVNVQDVFSATAIAEVSVRIVGEPDPPQTVVEKASFTLNMLLMLTTLYILRVRGLIQDRINPPRKLADRM